MPCCGPNGCCQCPPRDEAIRTLKQLFSAGMGMIAALALNEAMEKTFRKMDMSLWIYAIIVSLMSIFAIACIKIKLEAWARKPGFGDKGQAILALFKIAFCLLSASAWHDVINDQSSGEGRDWKDLLLIATLLTVLLIALLIFAFKLKEWWGSSSCCCACRPKLPGFIQSICEWFIVGFIGWIPITFGIVGGLAWNEFFETAIKGIFGDGAAVIIVTWLYALLTVPLAIAIVLLTHRVANQGCHASLPACCGKPCYGLENKIADPLAGMFEGEAAAIMAFAWDGAVRVTWREALATVKGDETGNSAGSDALNDVEGGLWIFAVYAVVACLIGVVAVLFTKRCTR